MNAKKKIEDKKQSSPMKRPLVFSVGLHLAVLILAFFGLPQPKPADALLEEQDIIEIAPLAEKAETNKPEKPKPAPPKEEPEPKPEPPKPEPPKEQPKPPAPEPEPKPKPEPVPEPPKEVLKKPEPKPEPPNPPEPKEEPKPAPEEVKKEEPSEDLFAAMLKDLTPTEDNNQPTPASRAPLGANLTMTELDLLRQQLGRCWNLLPGARDAQDLRVELRLQVNTDRTVRAASVVNQGRYNRDSFFRAAADAALRAVRNPQCNPLKLPTDKYDQWKSMVVVFDPQEMF